MKRLFFFAVGAGVLIAACSEQTKQPTAPISAGPEMLRFEADHPHTHIQLPRGFARNAARTSSTGINYHGGPLFVTGTKVVAIYWSGSTIYNGGPAAGTTGSGSQDGSVVGAFLRNLG